MTLKLASTMRNNLGYRYIQQMPRLVKEILDDSVPALKNIPDELLESVEVGLVSIFVPAYLPGNYGKILNAGMIAGLWYGYTAFVLPAVKKSFPQ